MQTMTRAHHDTVVERDAQHDFRPGGKDYQHGALPVIDSGTLVMLMNRLDVQRSRGLLTREEWIAEKQEVINRTVPGNVPAMYQRILDALPSTVDADADTDEAVLVSV